MTKAKDLRDQSVEELKAVYQDISKELFQMRNEMKVNRKMDKPHEVRRKKKVRAQVMTVLREKEMRS